MKTGEIYYSNQELENGIQNIARQIVLDNWKPDCIAGILRGGIIPAVYLSHWFNIPMIAIEWSTRDEVVGKSLNEKIMTKLYDGQKILLVDDICDSGLTLEQVANEIENMYYNDNDSTNKLNMKSACLHYNISQTLFEPNYYHIEINREEDSRWIIYPWENM